MGAFRDWYNQYMNDTLPPPQAAAQNQVMTAIDHDCDSELDKARASAHELHLQLQGLKSAVSSIVLRLKVLDLDQMGKDLGEDGTVPLRMALSELRLLVNAYDGIRHELHDYSMTTAADYGRPYLIDPRANMYNQGYWSSSSSTTKGKV